MEDYCSGTLRDDGNLSSQTGAWRQFFFQCIHRYCREYLQANPNWGNSVDSMRDLRWIYYQPTKLQEHFAAMRFWTWLMECDTLCSIDLALIALYSNAVGKLRV